jgi:hypothetical protein
VTVVQKTPGGPHHQMLFFRSDTQFRQRSMVVPRSSRTHLDVCLLVFAAARMRICSSGTICRANAKGKIDVVGYDGETLVFTCHFSVAKNQRRKKSHSAF